MFRPAELRQRPLVLDVGAALVLTALTQYEVWTVPGVAAPRAAQAACFATMTLSVAGWRRAPLTALAVATAAVSVQTVWLGEAPVVGGLLALLVLTAAVAAGSQIRQALLGLAVICAGVAVEPVADAQSRTVSDALGNAVIFGLVWAAGRVIRRLRREGASWQHRVRDLEQEREQQLQAALADERRRIARELHDVVAHSVSVMVLQAGAARQHLSPDPQRARQPLLVVEDVGREALDELHRLLQVLRTSGDPDRQLAGLHHLEQLVEHVRSAGLLVDVQVEGRARRLAPGLDLTAYRVLQEGLTNVLKHAPTAHAHVGVTYTDRELLLSIVDDGGRVSPNGRSSGTGGHGLLGMRERVLLYGGRVEVGPTAGGGFGVHARLPLLLAADGT